MIDRITIYINDVEFDDVKDRLGLSPSGVAKDESLIYSSSVKNLKFEYKVRRLNITGSLHKYAKGDNYSLFTYDEARGVLHELSEIVGIPLNRFVVFSIELGVNIQMDRDVERYLKILHSYKLHPFVLMSPLKGTSKFRGNKCTFSKYVIKFYDKTFETIRRNCIPKEERYRIPANLLRYEIQLSRKQLKSLGFTNVTGKNLLSPLHYTRFKRLMKRVFDNIVFDDAIDYTGCLEDDIKKHIFVMSDKYGYYLQCLKDYFGETEYRKERRRTNELLKRMSSLPKGELETELKSKFETTISKV
ncbi:hypothetical protein JN06_02714 [Bacteroides zoogleoformans]|uniref:Uncharacterized protein n=1 Tax=Bacteroides zoogleoformans TaxID=28119 RepID=A0ABN5IPH7_9BACE|nr:hypothetical protein [Bacteroides zoogleoformans]AVM53826.1 hypothetical protein C4H11_13735 [Bacteroides zoogleoformans]TWJ08388.1 hypothetical protein JN06_02714 [Bacteroides zoogleoformans]